LGREMDDEEVLGSPLGVDDERFVVCSTVLPNTYTVFYRASPKTQKTYNVQIRGNTG
jgi:hypothetical protein